ncbi:MAG: hypothetical protein HFE83_09435 [Lachnospiraceae bacterium]|jgi:hypothetical protein|nr:hypothetical protein [Lachnospiraceae bacterium]
MDARLDTKFDAFRKETDVQMDVKLEAAFDRKLAPAFERLDGLKRSHIILREHMQGLSGQLQDMAERLEGHSLAVEMLGQDMLMLKQSVVLLEKRMLRKIDESQTAINPTLFATGKLETGADFVTGKPYASDHYVFVRSARQVRRPIGSVTSG